MAGRDSGLPPDTRDVLGMTENVFGRLPAQQGHPQDFSKIHKFRHLLLVE